MYLSHRKVQCITRQTGTHGIPNIKKYTTNRSYSIHIAPTQSSANFILSKQSSSIFFILWCSVLLCQPSSFFAVINHLWSHSVLLGCPRIPRWYFYSIYCHFVSLCVSTKSPFYISDCLMASLTLFLYRIQ